jgi:hypothetical protein
MLDSSESNELERSRSAIQDNSGVRTRLISNYQFSDCALLNECASTKFIAGESHKADDLEDMLSLECTESDTTGLHSSTEAPARDGKV